MNQIDFSPEELAAFREELFQGFTDSQFNLAIAECKRRNLVPGQHVYFQVRKSSEWDPVVKAKVPTKKLTKITTIDAFRLVSQRTGEYEGQGKARFYYLDEDKNPTVVTEIPLPHPELPNTPREPWACVVPIYRKGFREPVEVACRFDAYAVTFKNKSDEIVLTDMWSRRGPEQLAKCAEAASRRVAFPEELGSMYLSEEFQREDADNAPAAETPSQPTTEAPKAVSVPAVNHQPATPTNDPRPEEPKPEKPKKTAKETKIEDVVLDKVEVVTEAPVQKMDTPKGTPSDRLRALIAAGVHKDNLKKYILDKSGKPETKSITGAEWNEVLTPLETLLAAEDGGKDAVNNKIVEVSPAEEDL